MNTAARRTGGRAARQLTSRRAAQQQRRFESNDSHGHSSSSSSAANVPASEGISYKFWLGLGIFPVSYFVYNASRPSESGVPAFSKLIDRFSEAKEDLERKNALHTAALEQAAHDRNLFQGESVSKHMDLGFPEVFNTGSPINVPAGHYTNIDKVIEHYQKQNAEQTEKTKQRLAAGKQLD